MAKRKNTLTTGDIGRVCNVSLRTAQKWFDKGTLVGFLLPGSKNRRVHVTEFKAFLEEYKMPMDEFMEDYKDVL